MTRSLPAALRLAAALAILLAPAARAEPTRYFRSEATRASNRPFSDAVQIGPILYLSGQIGAKPGAAAPVPGGLAAQARQAMDNIGQTLKDHGLGYDNLFKCTVFLADMRQWGAFNAIYATYFKPDRLPARSALGVNGLALGAEVEVECWANTQQ